MSNSKGCKSPPIERQDTQPCMDNNTFNFFLDSSPSTNQMLDNLASGTFFGDISSLSESAPSGPNGPMDPASSQLVVPTNASSVTPVVGITSSNLAAALRRANSSGGGSGPAGRVTLQGLPGVVNFTRVPSSRPHASGIQGYEDNNQCGADMTSMVQQEHYLQAHQVQQQQLQIQHQPQMQFDNYANAGSYYGPNLSSVAHNAVMPYTQPQTPGVQYQRSEMQVNSGYQSGVMPSHNISALNSLPHGVTQIQNQFEVLQAGPVGSATMYLTNTRQITTAPCVSQGISNALPSSSTPGTSSYDSSSFPAMIHSPGTQEASEAIEEMIPADQNESRVTSLPQLSGLSVLNELNDTDFSSEPKFNPSLGASKMEKEINEENLNRADSIDVLQLTDWPGKYNFTISFPTDSRNNRKWGYCDKLKRVFCQPNIAIEVQIRVDDWRALEGTDAKVRLCPVYTDAHHRTKPVNRCDHHKLAERMTNESVEVDYLIQIDQKNAEYSHVGPRQVVSAPLLPSRLGDEFVTLLVKSSCMTSCVGGPNRRPFAVIFSLMVHEEEVGRQCPNFRICCNPSRDMKAEQDRRQAALVKAEQATAASSFSDSASQFPASSDGEPVEEKPDVFTYPLPSLRQALPNLASAPRRSSQDPAGVYLGKSRRCGGDGSSDREMLSQSSDSDADGKRFSSRNFPVALRRPLRRPFVALDGMSPGNFNLPNGYYCEKVERKYLEKLEQYVKTINCVNVLKMVEGETTDSDH